jgi:hypothetical protein
VTTRRRKPRVSAAVVLGGTVLAASPFTSGALGSGCGRSESAATTQAPDERTYLCPMRCTKPGETRFYTQRGPGECPVCGMALEVATPADLQELAGIRTPVPSGDPTAAPHGHSGTQPPAGPHEGHGQPVAPPPPSGPAVPTSSAPPTAAEPHAGHPR